MAFFSLWFFNSAAQGSSQTPILLATPQPISSQTGIAVMQSPFGVPISQYSNVSSSNYVNSPCNNFFSFQYAALEARLEAMRRAILRWFGIWNRCLFRS
jgi:hypothetical protein